MQIQVYITATLGITCAIALHNAMPSTIPTTALKNRDSMPMKSRPISTSIPQHPISIKKLRTLVNIQTVLTVLIQSGIHHYIFTPFTFNPHDMLFSSTSTDTLISVPENELKDAHRVSVPSSQFLKHAWNHMALMQRSCRKGSTIEPCLPYRSIKVDQTNFKSIVVEPKSPMNVPTEPQYRTVETHGHSSTSCDDSNQHNATRVRSMNNPLQSNSASMILNDLTNTIAITSIRLGMVVVTAFFIL
ncbi:hypothetical protein O5D80_006079 [Batrachochytrium dendrobatidis]|nr:hypothetical protein O5D80_006079 [Batrachochytrium dendrobatidis]